MYWRISVLIAIVFLSNFNYAEDHPFAADNITSLTNSTIRFHVSENPYVVMTARDFNAIIVNNSAIDIPELPGHLAGYNGIASLKHKKNNENLFVSKYAGLNFEHIHDGTNANLVEKFEPRKFPMELRIIDDATVELYQPPTKNFQLESCGRYHLTDNGEIEYTFECIPRAKTFSRGFIGLFWASYINAPTDKAIYFTGRPRQGGEEQLVKAISTRHGLKAVHLPADHEWFADVEETFRLSLVANLSDFVYSKPFYDGYRDGLRFRQSFERKDKIYFVQSPSGGGGGNPAWDFEWIIPDYQVNQAYGFTMKASYTAQSQAH